jgi:type I restriction enzyme S subunit
MNADRLLALYEKVAEAPDAVPRLRRFVLDLVVRGKLVPQEAGDEPASELLKRIAVEKARLVKAGEIRKPRDLANGDGLVPPFDIPASWRWCRLDTVGAIIGGGTPSAGDPENFAEPGEGIPWLTPADLGGFRELLIERGSRDLTEKGLASSSATMMPAGTVLFTSRAPIGYVAISANPISTNQGFKSIVPYVADCSRFIALAMQTFAPDIDAKAPGTTFKEVSGKIVAGVPFPLPPLAEQRRIVAKVEELMALLDRLEAARTAREATRDPLTAASLARLTAPDTDPADFQANARFALATLPALTTRPDQIKPLRQTILNLAVRGKLVEQDPTDEPASELLKRIARRRKELAAEDRVRKKKSVAPLADEAELDLPENWAADAFANLIDPRATISYGVLVPGPDVDDGVPFVRAQDLMLADHPERPSKTIALEIEAKYSRTRLNGGEILLCVVGSIGKLGIAPQHWAGANIARAVARISPVDLIDRNYLLLFLRSDRAQIYFDEATRTLAQPTLNVGLIEKLPVPLPPLAEQHRIVAKVDALMALCDRLEAALTTADTTRARLLEALLHEALDPAAEAVTEAAE